jgi:ABC-type nitrate/sulfonate/bicarbonate transport system substrate-binding protein
MLNDEAGGLLEILKSDRGLNYTFLDRSRPSLTFKRELLVPHLEIKRFHNLHAQILNSFSTRLRKIQSALPPEAQAAGPSPETVIATTSTQLRRSLFPDDLLDHILDFSPLSLLIRTDEPAVPWELVQLNGSVLSRKIPCGRSLITRQPLKRLRSRSNVRCASVLLIINPTEDLEGAEDELQAIDEVFSRSPYVYARCLYGKDATTTNLAKAVDHTAYDVIHYAGHSSLQADGSGMSTAFFHFADGPIDTRYVAKILERSPPALFFLNSCDSAVALSNDYSFDDLLGLSPALLRVGVEAVIGSLWPVIDQGGAAIARKFYAEVLSGKSIGKSLNEARDAVTNATGFPYWLGYSVFGDPNLTVISDRTWRQPFQSGGTAAAMATFVGRSMMHVSSLHSFLLNAVDSDTVAIAVACECRYSEALVVRSDLQLTEIIGRRPLNVGLPGKTGSAIFTRKMLEELEINPSSYRLIELDTAEVVAALHSGSVDMAGIWYPELKKVREDDFKIIFPSEKNSYTMCVLVARKPNTEEEHRAITSFIQTYKILSEKCQAEPYKWGHLLCDTLNIPLDDLKSSIDAFDFNFGGSASAQEMPEHIGQFIANEIKLLKSLELMPAESDIKDLFLWHRRPVSMSEGGQAPAHAATVAVDVQKSVSSLPLLVGRFEGLFA